MKFLKITLVIALLIIVNESNLKAQVDGLDDFGLDMTDLYGLIEGDTVSLDVYLTTPLTTEYQVSAIEFSLKFDTTITFVGFDFGPDALLNTFISSVTFNYNITDTTAVFAFAVDEGQGSPYFDSYMNVGNVISSIIRLKFSTSKYGEDVIKIDQAYLNSTKLTSLGEGVLSTIVYEKGDVDFDGQIRAYDAAHILNSVAGFNPFPISDPFPWEENRVAVADIDEDGLVTARDAAEVLKYVVGLIEDFNGNNKKTVPNVEIYKNDNIISFVSTELGLEGFSASLDGSKPDDFVINLDKEKVDLSVINEDKNIFALASTKSILGKFAEIEVKGITEDVITIHYVKNNLEDSVTIQLKTNVSLDDFDSNPIDFELTQNYPNPFNPSTQIQYALPEATQVTLEVFNSLGQTVMELVNGQQSAGYHVASFDAAGMSSGVYLYKLTTPSFSQTKKMLLIK